MRDAVRSALQRLGELPPRREGEGTPLITILALIEGEILAYLERYGVATLRELTRTLEWSSRLVTMAVGGLVRERLIQATQFGLETILEPVEPRAVDASAAAPIERS